MLCYTRFLVAMIKTSGKFIPFHKTIISLFLLTEILERRIVLIFCADNGWYWRVMETDPYQPVGTFIVETGHFKGYRPQVQDVDILEKLMTHDVESILSFKEKGCPLCKIILDACTL